MSETFVCTGPRDDTDRPCLNPEPRKLSEGYRCRECDQYFCGPCADNHFGHNPLRQAAKSAMRCYDLQTDAYQNAMANAERLHAENATLTAKLQAYEKYEALYRELVEQNAERIALADAVRAENAELRKECGKQEASRMELKALWTLEGERADKAEAALAAMKNDADNRIRQACSWENGKYKQAASERDALELECREKTEALKSVQFEERETEALTSHVRDIVNNALARKPSHYAARATALVLEHEAVGRAIRKHSLDGWGIDADPELQDPILVAHDKASAALDSAGEGSK